MIDNARRPLACVLLPALMAGALYLPTLGFDFVFDDRSQILSNPWVRELRNLPRAVSEPVWAFKVNYPTNYFRPLQMGSYNLLWAASGGSAAAFHALNVVLHMLATALLALLVLQWTRERVVAFCAAALFAANPIHAEAVSWIACLPELGLAVFALATLLLHDRLRWAAWICSALALASKETAIVVPLLVAALELVRSAGRPPRDRAAAALRAVAPYLAVAAGYLLLRRLLVGGMAFVQGPATPLEAVWSAPGLLLAYLTKMVWPFGLQAYYVLEPVRSPAEPGFFLPLAGLTAVGAAVALATAGRADLRLAALITLLPLMPPMTAPAVAVTFFSERYTYLPFAGLAWLLAAGLHAALSRIAPARAVVATVAAATLISATLAVLTLRRSAVWRDDERLATVTLAQEPRARAMWGLLATWHGTRGRFEEAHGIYRRAMEALPGDVAFEVEELYTRYLLHRISADELARGMETLVLRTPGSYEARYYLGLAHSRAGNAPAAELAFREAIRLNPSFKAAYDGLVAALISQGRTDVAEIGIGEASGFAVDPAQQRMLRAAGHLRAGREGEAEPLLREVLREDPESTGALLALALVASRRGDHEEAIRLCRRAIAIDPGLVDAHQQLGVSALRAGEVAEAVRALEAAESIDPNDKELLNRLGVAYASSGREEEAGRAWRRALEIDPLFEKARRNLARLEGGP